MKKIILLSLVALLGSVCYAASEQSTEIARINFSIDAPFAKVPQSQITASIHRGAEFIPDEIIIGFSPSIKTILGRGRIKPSTL